MPITLLHRVPRHPAKRARAGEIISAAPVSLTAPAMTLAMTLTMTLFLTGPAAAVTGDDPDWPCVQPKVAHLSVAQMWAGPPVDESLGDWRQDASVNRLARHIAARRTAMEEVDTLLDEFAAAQPEAERAKRLTLLFSASFDLIDRERSHIMSGIGRYARKQAQLAEKIDGMQEELNGVREAEKPDESRAEELQDQLTWDTRIYEERSQSLSYVCETPVILEQRIFALGRAIMARLK